MQVETLAPDLEDFLGASPYCDWGDSTIEELALSLRRRAGDRREAAIRAFEFVRDEVRYYFGEWNVPASETLARREGTCTNKNNLLVALLRALGIPAAYGILRVNGREYFGVGMPSFWKPLIARDSIHVYAGVYLDGRWIKCDSSTDREISEKLGHFSQQIELVRWDGLSDAMDKLDPAHIHADLGLRAHGDDILETPARNARSEFLALIRDYVDFIRVEDRCESAHALQHSYACWVVSNAERLEPRYGPTVLTLALDWSYKLLEEEERPRDRSGGVLTVDLRRSLARARQLGMPVVASTRA